MIKHLIAIMVTTSISCASHAAFDDTKDLKGSIIVYAGDFEQLSCPISEKYDCMKWPTNLFRHQSENFCFTTSNYSCNYSCQGVIAVDQYKNASFFVFERLGGVKKGSVSAVRCPPQY